MVVAPHQALPVRKRHILSDPEIYEIILEIARNSTSALGRHYELRCCGHDVQSPQTRRVHAAWRQHVAIATHDILCAEIVFLMLSRPLCGRCPLGTAGSTTSAASCGRGVLSGVKNKRHSLVEILLLRKNIRDYILQKLERRRCSVRITSKACQAHHGSEAAKLTQQERRSFETGFAAHASRPGEAPVGTGLLKKQP